MADTETVEGKPYLMTKPPSIATLKTFDILHSERGSRAAAASAYQRKRGRKRALNLCASHGCRRERNGSAYCIRCRNKYSREREQVKARGGQQVKASKQIDADPHVNSTVLLPGTIVACPILGCGWKGERRQMWRHAKEHRR